MEGAGRKAACSCKKQDVCSEQTIRACVKLEWPFCVLRAAASLTIWPSGQPLGGAC